MRALPTLSRRVSISALTVAVMCGAALAVIVTSQAASPAAPTDLPAPAVSTKLRSSTASSRVAHFVISVRNPAVVPRSDLTIDTGVAMSGLYYIRNVTGTTGIDNVNGTLVLRHFRIDPGQTAEVSFDANIKQGVTDAIRLAPRVLSTSGRVLKAAAPKVLPAPVATRATAPPSAVRSKRTAKP